MFGNDENKLTADDAALLDDDGIVMRYKDCAFSVHEFSGKFKFRIQFKNGKVWQRRKTFDRYELAEMAVSNYVAAIKDKNDNGDRFYLISRATNPNTGQAERLFDTDVIDLDSVSF